MAARQFAIRAAAGLAAMAWACAAQAGDAGHAWGTISTPGAVLLNSAAMHQQGDVGAGIVAQGPGSGTTTGGFPAVTSCGTCTTITIQGNNNSISGTSITSTNQGTVTSNGTFNE